MGLGISAKWGCEMRMTKRQAQMIISLEVDVCISDLERKLPKHPLGFQKSCHLQEHQNDTSNEWCKAATFEYRSWTHETQSCFISWELRVRGIFSKEHVQEFHVSAHWDLLSFILEICAEVEFYFGNLPTWAVFLGSSKIAPYFHLFPTNLPAFWEDNLPFKPSDPPLMWFRRVCLGTSDKLPWLIKRASKTSISGVLLLALTCTCLSSITSTPHKKK